MEDSEIKIVQVPTSKEVMLQHRNDDYEYGRELLYHSAEQLQLVLANAVALAQEAQHPRAIEVAKDAASTLADLAGKIMKHHEQQQKITGEVAKITNTTNNNLNVKMNTKELLDLLRKD